MPFVNFGPRSFGPRKRIINFKGDLDRLFEEFFGDEVDDVTVKSEIRPHTNIEDNGKSFILTMELPGMGKDDIKVSYQGGKLNIVGEKKGPGEKQALIKRERRFGKIARSFDLPSEVDSEGIEAAFENGVLSISLPKVAETVEPGVEVKIK